MFFATLLYLEPETAVTETSEISDEFRWNKLALRKFEVAIVEAFQRLRTIGVEPILIKGWAANRFYPKEKPRTFGDIDLAIHTSDFDRSESFLLDVPKSVSIDLHREFRHLDSVSWNELFGRSQLIRIDDTDIRIPSPEDHLRILCTHWLTDGGENKDRLWDIYYAVENRPSDFDWSVCLDSVSTTRRKWVVVTVAAAHKYLNLDISGLPFENEIIDLPLWMQKSLESSWNSDLQLVPLHACLGDRRLLWKQIRKRLPPNPITATVDVEGEFDGSGRLKYQIRSILKRTIPSIRRVVPAMFNRIVK